MGVLHYTQQSNYFHDQQFLRLPQTKWRLWPTVLFQYCFIEDDVCIFIIF